MNKNFIHTSPNLDKLLKMRIEIAEKISTMQKERKRINNAIAQEKHRIYKDVK